VRSPAAVRTVAMVALVLVLASGCGGDDDAAPATTVPPATTTSTASLPTTVPPTTVPPSVTSTTVAPSTTTTPPRSAVDLGAVSVTPIDDATGSAQSGRADELEAVGYVEQEFIVRGVARRYDGAATGPAVPVGDPEPYATRILVRRPAAVDRFSGRVVVEPFNTSAGRDVDAGWAVVAPLLVREHVAWVGVTERTSSVLALRAQDGARYGDLSLTSNGLAWDVLSQLGGLLAEGDARSPLADLDVEFVYQLGISQSAIELATYASAIHPLARMDDGTGVYDGYLALARSASMTPLDSGDAVVPAFEVGAIGPVDAPVVEVNTESDVQGSSLPEYTNPSGASVRRPDADEPDDRYRLWEVAGAAHQQQVSGCEHGGTTFPYRYFAEAGAAALFRWVEDGTAPMRADRIETERVGTVSDIARDDVGNALGGVRSPYVDVPLASYAPSDVPGPLCALAGVETPLPADELADRYPDLLAYVEAFQASLDETVADGFLLAADVDEIVEAANIAGATVIPS
jgi:hypothetical protein